MAEPTPQTRSRLPRGCLRRLGAALLLGAGLLSLGLVLFQRGFTIDLAWLRPRIEQRLATELGTPIHLGELSARIAPWPTLRWTDARLGTSGHVWLSLRQGEARLALLPLLRHGELRVARLAAAGLSLDLRRPPPAFGTPSGDAAPETTAPRLVEVGELELAGVEVLLPGGEAGHRFAVEHLHLEGPEGRPLRFEAVARVDGRRLELDGEGGTLAAAQGDRSWPLALRLTTGDVEVDLRALLPPHRAAPHREPSPLHLEGHVRAASVHTLAELIGQPLPVEGPLELRWRADWRPGRLSVTELEAWVAGSRVTGELDIDLDGERPAVSGTLAASPLELTPWLTPRPDAAPTDWRRFDLRPIGEVLGRWDLSLGLTAERVAGLDFDLAAVDARLELDGGRLELPFSALVEGSPVRGTVLAEALGEPDAQLELEARNVRPARFADAAADGDRIARLRLTASASGPTLGAWWRSLAFEARAQDVTARAPWGDPEQPPESIELAGLYLEQRSGRLSARGDLQARGVPLAFELETASVARLLAASEAGEPMPLTATVTGRLADLPFEVAGSLSVADEGAIRGEVGHLRLGRSDGAGRFERRRSGEAERWTIELESRLLDLDELVAAFDTGETDVAGAAAGWRGLPIVPAALGGLELELRVAVERLVRYGADLRQLSADLELAHGRVATSSLAFRLASASFEGGWALDLSRAEPSLLLAAETRNLDLGTLFEQQEVTRGLDLQVARMRFETAARGSTLGEVWHSARTSLAVEGAALWLHDHRGERREPIALHRGEASALPGGGLEAAGRGTFRGQELALELHGPRLLLPGGDRKRAIEARVVGAGTELRLHQLEDEDAGVEIALEGADLATLGPLLEADLPPFGPYRLAGRLRVEEDRWTFPAGTLTWGESRLEGSVAVRTGGERPQVLAELRSPHLRLEDVLPDEVLAWIDGSEEEAPAEDSGELSRLTLDADFLPAVDLDLELAVDALGQADGDPGSGRVVVVLDAGGLRIDPLRLRLGESSVAASLHLEPWPEGARARLRADVENLDYTPLWRHLAPETPAGGHAHLRIDLDTEAAWGEPLMAKANGTLTVLALPTAFHPAGLDLWGAGLVTSLVPRLGWTSSASEVHCLAAVLQLEGGRSQDLLVLIDTDRVRVRGQGTLDLADLELDLRLRPQPKQRALLSLATPVRITGRAGEYDTRIAPGGFFRSPLRYISSHLRLLRRPLPADGTANCVAAVEGRIVDSRLPVVPMDYKLAPEGKYH